MKKTLFLLLSTIAMYGQVPADATPLENIQITNNKTSTTATKVNVQEANGAVNTQTINTGFNKNIGLGGSDVVGANTLLNQYSTTPVDWTATAFNSGQVVFYAGKQWIAKMATVAGDAPAVSSKWEEITFEALSNKTFIVDATPTDGSNNAVSSNGVFDALATKAPISSVHNPVTLGTANGLSLATQQLSLGLASSGVTGALSGTDWNTFNNKQPAITGLTTNYLPKWNGSGLGNSLIFENGTNIGIGTTNPSAKLHIVGGSGYADNVASNSNATLKLVFADPNQSVFFGLNSNSGGTSFIQAYRVSDSSTKPILLNPYGGAVSIGTTDIIGTFNTRTGTDNNFSIINRALGGITISSYNDAVSLNRPIEFQCTELIVSSTISASPATTANQVVVKSQLDAVAGRPYKVFTALVTQTGTGNPSVVVLENTLGISGGMIRNAVGHYGGSFPTNQVYNKVACFVTSNSSGVLVASYCSPSGGGYWIDTASVSGGILTPFDGALINATLEIRVYN